MYSVGEGDGEKMQNAKNTTLDEMKANGICPIFWRGLPVKGGWFYNSNIEPIPGDTVANNNGRIGLYCGRGPGGTLWIAWDRTLRFSDNRKICNPRTEADYHTMTAQLACFF